MQSALASRRLRLALSSLLALAAGCVMAVAMASSAGASDTRGTTGPTNPGYQITKQVSVNEGADSDGPVSAKVGDSLDYTVTISNGDDSARVLSVSDDSCTLASQTSGFDGSDDFYDVNTSATFTCSRTVAEGDQPSIVNTACVTETPQTRGLQQCDSVTVNVLHVSVSKLVFDSDNCAKGRGDCWIEHFESAEPGDYLYFQVAVTNDGGATVNYTITDNGCFFFFGARSLPSGTLAPGETDYWYCEHYVTYDDPDPYVNEACADAYEQILFRGGRGSDARDCDTASADLEFNTITGQIAEDVDADGAKESGDGGLAGRTVRLEGSVSDRGLAVDQTTTTDSNGNYVFDRVQPGNYTVTSEVPEGWTCSYPSGCSYDVVMPFEEQQPPARVTNVGGNDFGHWTVGQIAGRAFTDTNGNGSEDGGEGPLSGFTHYVDLNDNGAQDGGEPAANSGGDGTFAITGLNPGSYRVRQVPGTGYTCTAPASCLADVTIVSRGAADVLFGDRPPGTAPPAPPPDDIGGELPDTAAARRVRLITPTGCRRRPFTAYVRGGTVTDRVVFSIDGRRVRTVTRSQGGRFLLRIDPRRFRAGAHRITARVTFEDRRIRSRTLRGAFLRCAAAAAPRFTG